jgi:hypothetical protein
MVMTRERGGWRGEKVAALPVGSRPLARRVDGAGALEGGSAVLPMRACGAWQGHDSSRVWVGGRRGHGSQPGAV